MGQEPKHHNPTPKAGRNLPAAIGVAVGLVALLLLSMLIHPIGFVILASVGCIIALLEMRTACERAGADISFPVLAVGAVGILTSGYRLGLEAAFVSFYAAVAVVSIWHLLAGKSPRRTVRNIAASIFCLGYVPLLAVFAVLMLIRGGPWAVVLFVLVTVANDTGGYAAGVLAGKHPMAPSISPKKSWEGFAGSVAATIAVSMIGLTLLGANWWWGLVLGLASAVTATCGDLAESLLKRDLGLKDMGSLLPGHGGIMDRLDSLLVTAPACFLIMNTALGW
ncbi:hypothetical protein BK816_05250 [Boudabousia tangfeifanii]|uniref:Phosphatidate cytidylyltransferase n=1 Tax=Boudabousia tangfeifanii TaxID=1912795 RepID=A0A1D9MMK4_9ACTO|nr:hypothetical protein BK816_05250 [Boudabousia tangfeifanii]